MTSREFRYAGFWVRAAARAIDVLVIVGIYNFFYIVDRFGASAGLWAPSGFEDNAPAGRLSLDNIVRGVFFLGFPIFYYVYLHGAYGQTFGKMALKIRVVNEDGTRLDYRRAFFRWLGYFLCVFTLYIGYLMAAFDRRKQGLHDRVCRTLVIHADPGHELNAGAGPGNGGSTTDHRAPPAVPSGPGDVPSVPSPPLPPA